MSSRDRDADDWFRRFTGGRGWFGSGGRGNLIGEFEEMRKEMERMFEETLQNVERVPKDLVREYQTPSGGKVRQLGPLVYGYSVTVGPDGKPVVREFGNVKPMLGTAGGGPQLTSEREPLADVVTTDKEVKVVVEIPGIDKKDIKVNVYDNSVEIFTTDTSQRKYRRVV